MEGFLLKSDGTYCLISNLKCQNVINKSTRILSFSQHQQRIWMKCLELSTMLLVTLSTINKPKEHIWQLFIIHYVSPCTKHIKEITPVPCLSSLYICPPLCRPLAQYSHRRKVQRTPPHSLSTCSPCPQSASVLHCPLQHNSYVCQLLTILHK